MEYHSSNGWFSNWACRIYGKTGVRKNPNYDTKSINAVKASLMGPLASIGDSIFWGTLKIIATGIGVSFAAAGSPFRTNSIFSDL